jgi:hypothetical protein
MKNALDEIECVPMVGNLEPPYQIISHPYCIDIISTYFSISSLDFENKENALQVIKEGIEYYCRSNKINFRYHFDNKLPLVISPSTNNFQWFFGLQIIGFDIHKINALLSFQKTRFIDDEIDFTTFIEFPVYGIVKNYKVKNNSKRLKILMDWVNNQRLINSNQIDDSRKALTNTQNKLSSNKSTQNKKPKLIQPSFILNGLVKDPDYFTNYSPEIVEVFTSLKGGGFIPSESDYENFKSILSGIEISRENRIEWTGKIKDLNRFIKLLEKNKIIKQIKFKWETTCNCFTNALKDLNPTMLRKSNGKNDNEDKLLELIQLFPKTP